MRMHKTYLFAAGALLVVAGGGTPALAAIYAFTGTRANVNVIDPPGTGRCAPLNTVSIGPTRLSSTGSSNLGAFASTQSHCIPGPPNVANPLRVISDGEAVYDFGAGDLLFATYSGTATYVGPGAIGIENLVATGGTGRFHHATGSWRAEGPLNFIPNPVGPGFVGVYSGAFAGTLNLPAVPEPATWGLLVTGFGLAGAAARRRRAITGRSFLQGENA